MGRTGKGPKGSGHSEALEVSQEMGDEVLRMGKGRQEEGGGVNICNRPYSLLILKKKIGSFSYFSFTLFSFFEGLGPDVSLF